ncbi:ribosomal protein s6 kinase delta-1 [Plakobranchus ocellatus]|uniref:Ribosomal protein s6 kinase delta-1 n=1 Tax=Plakobranchus ocellatus TaxID=259542 RepID=A0AAV4DXF5_9GAST|nr:ribosomal protein s6 kinase delta-1 [Plakobranchus ocellatus]
MAQDSRWSVHDNIWHFTVTDPQLHKKGFTVYKVTCKTFPIKAPETLTELICWKRYNDFKTLYKSLLALHKALHRRDTFPDFAKPKLFGRFDDDVIEERRQSAAELLKFVSTQPHLYKSLVFKQFLEDGKSPSNINPKGLDILVAAVGGHVRSDGNPPPDLVPSSAGLKGAVGREAGDDNKPLYQDSTCNAGDSHSFHVSPAVLNPTSVANLEEAMSTTDAVATKASVEAGLSKPTDLAVLEGTWNYPQVADNISLNSSNGKDPTDTDNDINDIDDEGDSAVATSLPDTDLAFFDPISHDASAVQPSDELSSGMQRSNSWLLEGLNFCAEMETNEAEEDCEGLCNSGEQNVSGMSVGSTVTNGSEQAVSTSDKTSSGELSSEFELIRTMSQSSDGSKVECGKGDVDLSAEWQSRSSSFVAQASAASFGSASVVCSNRSQQPPVENQQVGFSEQKSFQTSSRSHSTNSEKASLSSGGGESTKFSPSRSSKSNLLRRLVGPSKGSFQTVASRNKSRSSTEHSISSIDLGGKEDYIYLAASQISMAQNSEANGDFEVAFAYYKSGVGILLQGVQGDMNKTRRDAVRRKTAQYLMKAEDLFNRHLASEVVDERRWGADSFLSPSLDLDPSFAFIRGSVRELRNFQVLGTIDKVILVRDKGTDETFVIKSIPKSTSETERSQSVLPTSCPHMVSLHRFFETDNCIFLLLQYASGGKLWTYIGDYLHNERGLNCQSNVGPDLNVTNENQPARNVYSGTKMESEVSSSVEVLLESKDTILEPPSKDLGDIKTQLLIENKGTVQSSDGLGASAMRFSILQKRKDSDVIETDRKDIISSPSQTESNEIGLDTDNKNNHNTVILYKGLGPSSNNTAEHVNESTHEAESHDSFNDQVLETIPKHSTKTPLSRRLSNLSDDMYVSAPPGDSVLPSTPGLEEMEDGHFQKILGETHHNIEDFSINSFDSEDVPVRLNSSSSSCIDRIPSIPEDSDSIQCSADNAPENSRSNICKNETLEDQVFTAGKLPNLQDDKQSGEDTKDFRTRKLLASRHFSVDQTSSYSYFSQETQDLIRDAKKRQLSFSGILPKEDHQSVEVYAPTFNSDDLIRSSRDLLKHVDIVLSETNDSSGPTVSQSDPATLEVSSFPNQSECPSTTNKSDDTKSVTKQPSSCSNDSSAEEPSIYDLNRSSDDDPDENTESEVSVNARERLASSEFSFNSSPLKNTVEENSNAPVASSLNEPSGPLALPKTGSEAQDPKKFSCDSKPPVSAISTGPPTKVSPAVRGTIARLSLSRIDSKEMTRSASFECDLKSPTRNRAHTVAAMFERLDSTLADQARIPETSIKKWTAQMVVAVSRLHSLGIVCRDLKPSNILLGEKGQVILTYFCHLGYGDQELDWEAVDNIYAAPEVSSISGYNKACDWWSIGALLFELIVGKTLSECHPGGITSHTYLYIPSFVSDEARGLLEGLLTHNPNERLGSGIAGAEEIKAHPFFSGIDWHQLEYL